jgi:hypothetical protein
MMSPVILAAASSSRPKNRAGGIQAIEDVKALRYTVRTHSSRKLILEIEKSLNAKPAHKYSTRQVHPQELSQARARTLRS